MQFSSSQSWRNRIKISEYVMLIIEECVQLPDDFKLHLVDGTHDEA